MTAVKPPTDAERASPSRLTWATAACLLLVMIAFAGRYGLHRDELYFVEAGHHPDWGYPDQPPLVPLLAAAWHDLVGGNVIGFRAVPALLAAALVLIAALTSRALGGTLREQAATAVLTAVAPVVPAVGHLFSTTTFDVVLTSATILLLLGAISATAPGTPSWPRWLALGATAGLAMQVKTLPATVLAACAVGILLAGPRAVLRRPGPWVAAVVAGLIAAPNLLWQAAHGWPQLDLAAAIAAGSSGTSAERWSIVPLQATLIGPLLLPVLAAAVVRGLRPAGMRHRWIVVAYIVLLAFVVATGGKPYYAAGLLPALIAIGVPSTLAWLDRARWRRVLAVALLAVHVVVTAVITLPVLPARWTAPVLEVNYDAGETIGWPELTATITKVVADLPARQRGSAVIVTSNYGEAGALDRARRAGADLPAVLSGHNGYFAWGPPPDDAAPVILVGHLPQREVRSLFRGCREVAALDNSAGVDNDERGAPVRVCDDVVQPWHETWPQLRHLD
jgi:hypothetical protein